MARAKLSKAPFTEDERAKIEANRGLVIHYVDSHFGRSHRHRKDLIQEGYIALALSVRGYDPSLGVTFGTYATKAIRRRLARVLDRLGVIRMPNRCDHADLTDAEWKAKLDAIPKVKPIGDETRIQDNSLLDGAEVIDAMTAHDKVRAAVSRLPRREREIIGRYFGRDESMARIGVDLGVSRERVRQIKTVALNRLRESLRSDFGGARAS